MDTLFLGTRKGLVTYKRSNGQWNHHSTDFLGIPVNLTYIDPRSNTWWACLDHGHWGCKLQRSKDEGKTWEEVEAPKYPEGTMIKEAIPASVRYLWAMAQGGADREGVLYLGTEPGGLFISEDNGDNWELVKGLWDHPTRENQWFGGGRDYAGIHSIVVDPRDSNHIYVGISVAGVFETRDGGATWSPANKGLKADFLPDPDAEVGQDPHLLVDSPSNPEVMWQQNHCGIFRSTDGAQNWDDISEKDGPANFGFAVAVHEQNEETAWVAPGISDEVRVAVDAALCICRTENGGKSWTAQRNGLPQENAFDIVFRHALDVKGDTVAFGTTTGNFYLSRNGGDSWECLNHNLPMVYSVRFGRSKF